MDGCYYDTFDREPKRPTMLRSVLRLIWYGCLLQEQKILCKMFWRIVNIILCDRSGTNIMAYGDNTITGMVSKKKEHLAPLYEIFQSLAISKARLRLSLF